MPSPMTVDCSFSPMSPRYSLIGSLIASILAAADRPEADIRATAIFALAVIGTDDALTRVRAAVRDEAPAVAWNASFGLARHGDAGGAEVIADLLARGPLFNAVGDDPARQRDLFLNAVRSAGMVPSPMLQERLAKIADSDANLAARNEAIRLLEKKEKQPDGG